MTDQPQRSALKSVENDPPGAVVETYFWVDLGDSLKGYTPKALMSAFESGEVSADTAIRIKKDAPNTTFRKLVRELVWLAHHSEADEGADAPSLSLFEAAFQSAPIGMVLSDLAGRIQYTNEAFCRMLGYGPEELQGMRVGEISDPAGRDAEVELGNEVLSGKRHSFQIEKRFIRKDAAMVDTLLSISMVPDNEGEPFQVIAHVVDLTQFKAMEKEMHGKERLATVGRLAGGVVHDFNNLLTVITGSLPTLGDGDAADRKAAVAQVEAAAWAGARLTKQLMAFSRQGVVEAKTVSINQALKSAQGVLKGALGPDMTLRLDLTSSSTEIRIDPVQLEQVIMNLSFNAIQAMPDAGGCLTIRTRRTHDDGQARVAVEFEDTGVGMSSEVRGQAFEPFYTTRKSGGGTGLGLSTVHGIVVRFGGQISLSSTPGVGTCCRIIWPECDSSEVVPQPHPSAAEVQASNVAGRILVVDDNDGILRLMATILTLAGYEVEQASSAAQAMNQIDHGDCPYDMVIADVNLGDGNGSDVVSAARARWPSIRSLFISGYTSDVLSQSDVFNDPNMFLQKPFARAQLLQRVQVIFEQPPAET